MFEKVSFLLLFAESTDNTGSRKVFLHAGLESALCLVCCKEAFLYFAVEENGKPGNHRHCNKRDKCQGHRDACHKPVGDDDFGKDADDVCHFQHKVAHCVNVCGTALDNIAGVDVFVVCKGGCLQALEKALAHIVAQIFAEVV